MSIENRNAAPTAGRVGRSITAIIALAIGSLLLLGALVSAIPMMLSHFTDLWNGFADLSTARLPFEQDPNTLDGESSAAYAGVLLTSGDPLTAPRLLQSAQTALTLLVVVAGSLAAILLAIRLLRRRPFARHLRWSLLVLGLLVMVLATVGPQLEALAVDIAAEDLGYAIYQRDGDGILTSTTPDSIMQNLWDPIWVVGRFDLILLLVGGMVAMFGFLLSDGERAQRETDGLV
ncbi:hypothetical protein ACFPZL_03975 [Leucobacter soli]|uniref:Uncharacterized protein n=1 Tax=Leucobacter soli TaxID=2812850 RepID=A0A916JUY4_9MICO|nr:hypothetical protein [Leucobacter soli]CAG7604658.1 hypothetical protein LEUCIP111803_00750 [Leucobacter soli]